MVEIYYDRPVIELSKYIMQQTRVRLFLQQIYDKLTTNLQQTYDKLTTNLQQTYNKFTTDFGIDLRQTYNRLTTDL